MRTNLTDLIVKSIHDNDMNEMLKLKKLCDYLHKGGTRNGYNSNDLPTDNKYEELCTKINSKRISISLNSSIKIADNANYVRKDNNLISNDANHFKHNKIQKTTNSILIMDGIELPEKIPTIGDCIIMPKFDGCTVGFSIQRNGTTWFLKTAHTRGSDSLTGDRKSQDITNKISELIDVNYIMNSLLKQTQISIKIKDDQYIGNIMPVKDFDLITDTIEEIRIRGECVKKNKNISESAVGYVAGGILGGDNVWNSKKSNLCIKAYEIGLIITTTTNIVPTQDSALAILKYMDFCNFEYLNQNIDENTNMINILETFQESVIEPLDGLVYCNCNWTYPQNVNENSKKVNYGKYKFKKNNIAQTEISGITYSIGATGKYTAILLYNPVRIGDKNYKQAKMALGRLEKLEGLGIGVICDIELKKDINPMVIATYPKISNVKEKINIINNCLYCNEKLKRSENKNGDVVLTCTNNTCIGKQRMKVINLLNSISYKGISEKTLININYKSFKDLWTNYLTIKKKSKKSKTPERYEEFTNCLNKSTITEICIGLGIESRTKIMKLLNGVNINGDLLFLKNFDLISDFLINSKYFDDILVSDFIEFCSEYMEDIYID